MNNHYNEINAVISRYVKINSGSFEPWGDRFSFVLDLEFSKMDLTNLLTFGDSDFLHDISGLYGYFDREKKEFTCCFMPRCGILKEVA